MSDWLIVNADIVNEGRRFAADLRVRDGRIKSIAPKLSAQPGERVFDARGRLLMPGMIDAHLHTIELGLSLLTLDLSGTKSLDEAKAKIADYAKSHPDTPWILGRGWNQETWGLGRFPTAAELDAVVADRPIWLVRVDGHAGWANSLALAAGGVTAKTADPAGGRIERVAGSRTPAGVLVDNAQSLVAGKVPPPRPQDRDRALFEAQKLLEQNGVTAVGDMDATVEDRMT